MNVFISELLAFSQSLDKTQFFFNSPSSYILTPVGFVYVLCIFSLSFIFGFIYQSILKRIAMVRRKGLTGAWGNRARAHNIGNGDRWLRAIIGFGLFGWALTTTWSPTLFFFSGFSFFEALFSWCGFYAAIGKNSCPIS